MTWAAELIGLGAAWVREIEEGPVMDDANDDREPLTKGTPRITIERDLEVEWSGRRPGRFGCYLCGVMFKVGDVHRWIYDNDGRSRGGHGNFMVCAACDGPDVRERWWGACAELARRFWWALE